MLFKLNDLPVGSAITRVHDNDMEHEYETLIANATRALLAAEGLLDKTASITVEVKLDFHMMRLLPKPDPDIQDAFEVALKARDKQLVQACNVAAAKVQQAASAAGYDRPTQGETV